MHPAALRIYARAPQQQALRACAGGSVHSAHLPGPLLSARHSGEQRISVNQPKPSLQPTSLARRGGGGAGSVFLIEALKRRVPCLRGD